MSHNTIGRAGLGRISSVNDNSAGGDRFSLRRSLPLGILPPNSRQNSAPSKICGTHGFAACTVDFTFAGSVAIHYTNSPQALVQQASVSRVALRLFIAHLLSA